MIIIIIVIVVVIICCSKPRLAPADQGRNGRLVATALHTVGSGNP